MIDPTKKEKREREKKRKMTTLNIITDAHSDERSEIVFRIS